MLQKLTLSLLMFLLSHAVWAESCNDLGQEVFVKLRLYTSIDENDFSGVILSGEERGNKKLVQNYIEWPLLSAHFLGDRLCITKINMQSIYTPFLVSRDREFSPQTDDNKSNILALPQSGLELLFDSSMEQATLNWNVDIVGVADLVGLKRDKHDNLQSSCVLQRLSYTGEQGVSFDDGIYKGTVEAVTPELTECMGEDSLYSHQQWFRAKPGNKNFWNLSLQFIVVPESEPGFENSIKNFFKAKPADKKALKRLKKK